MMKKSFQKSFTLTETLIYISILSILVVTIISFILWLIHANTKVKVMRNTLYNTQKIMRILTNEIREAKSIYTPTSTFDSHPGQLSLETTKYLPEEEKTAYIDFYLCDSRLCFKKESQDPIVLTSEKVEITNLVFTQILSGEAPAISINLTVSYKNPANRPEYQSLVNLTSTTALRSY